MEPMLPTGGRNWQLIYPHCEGNNTFILESVFTTFRSNYKKQRYSWNLKKNLAGQSQTLLRSTNYHDAIQASGRAGHPINGNSMASSRATLDTALYSNVRSRPSSMLFNDSGFVRLILQHYL
jgi:hypothetical protein